MADQLAEQEFRKGIKELPVDTTGATPVIYTELDFATVAEARAGTIPDKAMSPALVKEAVVALAPAATVAPGTTLVSPTLTGATLEGAYSFAANISSGAVTINLANGTYQYATITAATTINLPAAPASSRSAAFTIEAYLSGGSIAIAGQGTTFHYIDGTTALPTGSGSLIHLYCIWSVSRARWLVSASTVTPGSTAGVPSLTVKQTYNSRLRMSWEPVTGMSYRVSIGGTIIDKGTALSHTTGTLTSGQSVTVGVEAYNATSASGYLYAQMAPLQRRAQIMVGDPALITAYDAALRDHLVSLGMAVTFIDDTGTYTQGNADILYVSNSVATTGGDSAINATIPLIAMRAFAWDNIDISTQGSTSGSTTYLDVLSTNLSHPILAGFAAGQLPIYDVAASVNYVATDTGSLAPGATLLARYGGNNLRASLFVLEEGAATQALYGPANAPALRVGFPLAGGYETIWNANAKKLVTNVNAYGVRLDEITVTNA